MNILVVDDNRDILESTVMLLEAMGHKAFGHDDAATVPAAIERHDASVVLHDVNMPGLEIRDQVEALAGPAAVRPVQVILFTASVQVDEVAGIPGIRAVVPKPFGLEDLEKALASVV